MVYEPRSAGGRLTTGNTGEELVAAVPELRPAYEETLAYWAGEEPGLHNLFGDVVNPCLMRELRRRDSGEDLDRIFGFLERMATANDELANVVAVTVCERLGDEWKVLRRAQHLMGPKTRELSDEVERFWGRDRLYRRFINTTRQRLANRIMRR
jgi:hypothetical protein